MTDRYESTSPAPLREQLARFYNWMRSEDQDDWEDYRDWIIETRDPMSAFDGRNWRESSGKAERNGMIFWERVQVAKGQPRQNIAVADAGEVRLVITDA